VRASRTTWHLNLVLFSEFSNLLVTMFGVCQLLVRVLSFAHGMTLRLLVLSPIGGLTNLARCRHKHCSSHSGMARRLATGPYPIKATLNKICFDKFHVKKLILDALDKVREAENISRTIQLVKSRTRCFRFRSRDRSTLIPASSAVLAR
jgi:hypothetical protein